MSAHLIRRAYIVDGEQEADIIHLYPLPNGRVEVRVPSESSLRNETEKEWSVAELRALATALIAAADDAEGRKS